MGRATALLTTVLSICGCLQHTSSLLALWRLYTHPHAVHLQVLKSDALNKDREVLGTEVGIVDAMRFQGVAMRILCFNLPRVLSAGS